MAKVPDTSTTSNRSFRMSAMKSLNMVEAASYLTPNMSQQITHKDKAAPPTSWTQFVLDPLIMQQFYFSLSSLSPDPTEIASIVRAFVMEEELLPPDRLDSLPAPMTFQRFDHWTTHLLGNKGSAQSTLVDPRCILAFPLTIIFWLLKSRLNFPAEKSYLLLTASMISVRWTFQSMINSIDIRNRLWDCPQNRR